MIIFKNEHARHGVELLHRLQDEHSKSEKSHSRPSPAPSAGDSAYKNNRKKRDPASIEPRNTHETSIDTANEAKRDPSSGELKTVDEVVYIKTETDILRKKINNCLDESETTAPEVRLMNLIRAKKTLTSAIQDTKKKIDELDEIAEQTGQMEYKEEKSSCQSSKLVVLEIGFVLYMVVGSAFLTQIAEMELVDALYLIVIIFTTVGYGIPNSKNLDGSANVSVQIFMSFYILVGVAFIGGGLSVIFEVVLRGISDTQKKQLVFFEEDDSDGMTDGETVSEVEEPGIMSYIGKFFLNEATHWCIWLTWLFGGAFVIGHQEGWTWVTSVYFAVVSGSTVGFGDYEPSTATGKWCMIFYLPMLITLTGLIFSYVLSDTLSAFHDEHAEEMERFQAGLGKIIDKDNVENFADLDADGDGKLTETEFILQCLINDYNVDHDKIRCKIKLLKEHFAKVDTDKSGFITIDDFKNIRHAPVQCSISRATSI